MTHISLADAVGDGPARWSAVIAGFRSRAAALADEFAIAVPPYDVLPSSLFDADFVPSARLNVELFFRYATDGVEPTEDDTRPLVERAVKLVRDGMPLEEVLANYRIGIDFFWSQVVPSLAPGDYPMLPELGARLTTYSGLVIARIAIALVEDARQPRWDLLEQNEIAAALLAGRDPSEWVRDPGATLAQAYLVAVVRQGESPPGTLTGLRYRIGNLPGAFLHRDRGGWTALIPQRSGDHTDPARALAARLALREGLPHPRLWLGVAAAATHAAIPDAYAEATIVAETARCLDRPDVICRRQDMMFEYAIATTGTALPSLAALLDPLDEHPLLGHTLDAYVANQFNHNATARTLYIHRNTVTYRLTRITDLTGYDPQDPAGISTLMAARVARALLEKSFRT
ncbi:PucR family transcriptional regulator [Nocardia sp. NPDC052566]|uniref:PucR family transcriptional regulator n=1 Tax=Nocardia sp. NPDC052566 TaxID=3364330 RepID=UPI0037C71EFE